MGRQTRTPINDNSNKRVEFFLVIDYVDEQEENADDLK